MSTVITQVRNIRIKHKTHKNKGDCRCAICVDLLANVYKGNNRSILTAPRCFKCNFVLSHPQWLENGASSRHPNYNTAAEIDYARKNVKGVHLLCCACLPDMEQQVRARGRRHLHVASGILGAQARYNRELTFMCICTVCDGAFNHLVEDEPFCPTCYTRLNSVAITLRELSK